MNSGRVANLKFQYIFNQVFIANLEFNREQIQKQAKSRENFTVYMQYMKIVLGMSE
jgi:hypothetical protein